MLEDVYASSDVNIVMMMFFELFYSEKRHNKVFLRVHLWCKDFKIRNLVVNSFWRIGVHVITKEKPSEKKVVKNLEVGKKYEGIVQVEIDIVIERMVERIWNTGAGCTKFGQLIQR